MEAHEARQGSTIVLRRRDDGRADRRRSYKVELDGKPHGTIDPGDTLRFDVVPGRHELRLKLDWAGSPLTFVEAPETGEVVVECRPAIQNESWWALAPQVLWYGLVRPRNWIELQPVDG